MKVGAFALLSAKFPAELGWEPTTSLVLWISSQSRGSGMSACRSAPSSLPGVAWNGTIENSLARGFCKTKHLLIPIRQRVGKGKKACKPSPTSHPPPWWRNTLPLPLLHFSSILFITLDMCRKTGLGIQTCASCVSLPGNHPLLLAPSITSNSKWLWSLLLSLLKGRAGVMGEQKLGCRRRLGAVCKWYLLLTCEWSSRCPRRERNDHYSI